MCVPPIPPIVSQRTSVDGLPLEKHEQKQDTDETDRQQNLVLCVSVRLLFGKAGVEPKEGIASGKSAQTDCFLDSSCAWLPQTARLFWPHPWHSASTVQRHPARSTPSDNTLEVGFRRGEAFPFNCTHGVHLKLLL